MGCCHSSDPLGHVLLTKSSDGTGFILENRGVDTFEQLLSDDDINNVQSSWQKIEKSNFKLIGLKFMLRIFTQHEHLKPMWRFARHLDSPEDLVSSQEVKSHGERVFNAINLAVSKLRSPSELTPILVQLGFNHYFYGAREEHIPVKFCFFFIIWYSFYFYFLNKNFNL